MNLAIALVGIVMFGLSVYGCVAANRANRALEQLKKNVRS
jgi:magnesium-transporting ATPase (P-type)